MHQKVLTLVLAAMELLAENPEDINAFEIISRVNNELLHGT